MRIALALGVLALVLSASAAGSTPAARILFVEAQGTSSDIVTLDADATSYRNLTPGQAAFYVFDTDGSWSPDGSRITFSSHRDSNVSNEIYVMDADGSNQTRLTHDGPDGVQTSGGGVFDISPRWAPFGGTIAYLKVAGGGRDVWTMGPDGTGQHALTTDGGTKSALAWSPDGSRLLYQSQAGIWVVGAPAGAPVKVADGVGPVWSPDGSRIAYGTSEALWTVGADGKNVRRVASLPAYTPAWSPDGSWIAFVGVRFFPERVDRFGIPARPDVFVVHPDGSGLRRLTGAKPEGYTPFGLPTATLPTWWPDGSRIFFVSQRQPGPPSAFVMNADGTCEGAFVTTGTQLADPQWRPGSAPGLGPLHCVDLRVTPALAGGVVNPTALGQDAGFAFAVDNDGNETATGVRVEVKTAAPSLTLSGVSATCSGPTVDITCELPPIPAGGTQLLSIAARSSHADNYAFTVFAAAVEHESDPATNTTSSVVSVLPCTRVGTWGDDVIYGTPRRDKICALPGRDEVYGGRGNDLLDSGNGSDIVAGGPGRDVILARGGNDTIYARDGERDDIDCGSERDLVLADRLDVTHHCETVVRPKR
jgi:Tol biopolymer transport system component